MYFLHNNKIMKHITGESNSIYGTYVDLRFDNLRFTILVLTGVNSK